jgi:hypothetical protein
MMWEGKEHDHIQTSNRFVTSENLDAGKQRERVSIFHPN